MITDSCIEGFSPKVVQDKSVLFDSNINILINPFDAAVSSPRSLVETVLWGIIFPILPNHPKCRYAITKVARIGCSQEFSCLFLHQNVRSWNRFLQSMNIIGMIS